MNYIDTEIKPEAYEYITVDEAEENKQFVDMLNYLIEEGFIQAEKDVDGEPRLFAVTS